MKLAAMMDLGEDDDDEGDDEPWEQMKAAST